MEEWLTFHSSFHLFQDPSVVQFLNNKKNNRIYLESFYLHIYWNVFNLMIILNGIYGKFKLPK